MMESSPAAIMRDARPPRVVVCDDAPQIRDLLRDIFEDAGYEVRAFAAPPDLNHLAALRPDAVVLDLLYDGSAETGWALLHQVRGDPAFATLPLVLCTGSAEAVRDDGAAETLRRLDVRVIPKPFDIDIMLTVLAAALGGRPVAPGLAASVEGRA